MSRPPDRFPPLNALRAFEAAARHLSFKRAAAELFVTPGAVSHQVKLLESHLGVPLFLRLTRALQLTPEGHALLPQVREGLDRLLEAVERVRALDDVCALTVHSPPNFAARWLVPRLNHFTAAYPQLELHVASRPDTIDGRELEAARGSEGNGTPFVQVRFGDGDYAGARVDQIFPAEYVPVCSPRLIDGEHPLKTPEDLRFHVLLNDDTVPEERGRADWDVWLRVAGLEGLEATRGPRFRDASLALEAAIEGMGVALAIKPLLTADIEAGRLVVPFDIAAPSEWAYFLVTPESYLQQKSVARFREWILAEAEPARRARSKRKR